MDLFKKTFLPRDVDPKDIHGGLITYPTYLQHALAIYMEQRPLDLAIYVQNQRPPPQRAILVKIVQK